MRTDLFDRSHPSVERTLQQTGGIQPSVRKRSQFALSLSDREEISRGLVTGKSFRAIAASLARSPSTIRREVQRNGGADFYRASEADQSAWDRALRPKVCKLSANHKRAR